jgi:hypothetical protein
MTDDELANLPERHTGARLTLIDTEKIEARDAEIERLRGLIAQSQREHGCTWCEGGYLGHPEHADCPAFTEGGEVR